MSAECFTGFSIAIAIEIAMPVAQQLLGFGIGADLAAAVTAAAWGCAIWDDRLATITAEVPRPGDAARHLPNP